VAAVAPARLGTAGWLCIALVTGLVLRTDLSRFYPPVGEKFVPVVQPGAIDFLFPFSGARALLLGVNPYRNDRPELADPFHRDEIIDGVVYRQLYPPTHFLIYLPLALVTDGDPRRASQIWLTCNVWFLATIALLCGWLLRRVLVDEAPAVPWALTPFFAFALACNPGGLLALERGQSDILSALLCWAAVALVLRERIGSALFFATWAALIKGYAVVFAAGLALFALDRRTWKAVLFGGSLALLVWLLPVVRYLGDAARVLRYRSNMFGALWLNHSFKNVMHALSPAWEAEGRLALTAMALVATALAFLQARRAWRGRSPDSALWITLATAASLAVMVGYPSLSYIYNSILFQPGALILGLAQKPLARALSLSPVAERVAGAATLVTLFCLFVGRFSSNELTIDGFGVVALLAMIVVAAGRALTLPPPHQGSSVSG
jgi:hypothetical protein